MDNLIAQIISKGLEQASQENEIDNTLNIMKSQLESTFEELKNEVLSDPSFAKLDSATVQSFLDNCKESKLTSILAVSLKYHECAHFYLHSERFPQMSPWPNG